MKVAGFSFIRNAIAYDYPVVEAIQSVLPLCDVFYVAVGNSSDETRQLIENIGSTKINIIDTVWDDSLREGGRVLALETEKAYRAIAEEVDWCIYIQGDEVIPEYYHNTIRQAMHTYKNDLKVEGLLLKYLHFYGSYDYVGDSRKWYRSEIRIVRKDPAITSFRDAQGFKKNGRCVRIKPIDAYVYHYGWVKHPSKQQDKQKMFNKYWHDDNWMKSNISDENQFDYSQTDSLKLFEGQHPQVMQERIQKQNWSFSFDPTKKTMPPLKRFLYFVEKTTGYRIGEYKNYKLI